MPKRRLSEKLSSKGEALFGDNVIAGLIHKAAALVLNTILNQTNNLTMCYRAPFNVILMIRLFYVPQGTAVIFQREPNIAA